jgi:quercetin dioxygenase-like cupin family protein
MAGILTNFSEIIVHQTGRFIMKPAYIPRIIFVTVISVLLIHPGYSQDEGKAFILNYDDEGIEWNPCPEFIPEGCQVAIIQGDPAGPNADVLFKFSGGTFIPHHWHTSAERMILIQGEFHIDFDGQDPVVMTAGTYAYGPAKLPHTAECVSTEPCYLFVAFEEPVDAIPTED